MMLPSADWNSLLSGLIGAVVGGLIAAFSTIWAARWGARRAFQYSKTLQDQADRETTRRVLLAIKTEVETIWSGYEQEAGHLIAKLKPGEGLDLTYKLRQQYFRVYDSNAQFLGHVESDELRSAIVRTYVLAKGLLDSHLLNNDLLAEHQRVAEFTLSQTNEIAKAAMGSILVQNQQRVERNWKNFGTEIKTAYDQTKASINNLLQLLRQSDLFQSK